MRVSTSHKIAGRLIAAAQIAGLLATAWYIWAHYVLPRLGFQSLVLTAAQSLLYVTLAWLCSAIVTFWVYFVAALADLPRASRFSLSSSSAAMWFAPAIVLLSAPVPGAFIVSLVLVANATRRLIAQWGIVDSPIHKVAALRAPPVLLFRTAGPDADFLSWNSVPVLAGSFAAQAGLVALLLRHPFRAAALFALSTAILTSLSIATGAYRPGKPPALPHSALSVVLTFLLAATLTFGGIAARGRGGRGSETASGSPGTGGQSATSRVNDPLAPPESAAFGGDFPGVILLPELKPYTTLFVPVPATPGKFGAPLARPVGIPFSGEYWMFRWPAERPPRRSIIRRGSITELSFHTTDGVRLEMEAHQKLDSPVSVGCCSQIQVAIRNADPYPGTVSIELLLIDTTVPINLVQSLGSAVPAGQVLTYSIPPIASLQKFDELKVVFHRDRIRADKSAKISIERFILVP
jgi:hypothetical protein